ncbi:pyridoxamine 5'-phosphate oxidase family protein [Promicromonospora sp. NPDC050880]|uniref:pyridoxamine 5'-phosphate oxidase family protein n=1 Tax=Promicromonospora sp. NPDC050880 TaxID=3364406 RepID=UPI0037AD8C6A
MDADNQSITPMTEDECWEFLAMQPIGRLATAVGGEPEIFPLNFAVADRNLYFHTIPGTKVAEVAINGKVAFEVDQWGPEIAYSVVVKGTAEILETDADIASAEATNLVSYLEETRDTWVRITPSHVTGRRLRR